MVSANVLRDLGLLRTVVHVSPRTVLQVVWGPVGGGQARLT
jgi:hypothetical protein